ncbi:MAG: transcriptional regulator, partial [Candidatus Aenigmarchaeota archaeon]|nr:transcriptional regulator [Candidatus Aenigmarchaeota archaeon]
MNDNYSEILNTLSESERKLFPYLKKTLDLDELIEISGSERVEVMRALMWLANKKIIETKLPSFNAVVLDTFGEQYKKEGFPEKKIIQYLSKNKKADTKELAEKLKLSEGEISSTIGILKRNRAIDIEKKDSKLYLIITDEGEKLAKKKTCEEKFLEKKFPLKTESLSDKGQKTLNELKLRKNFIKVQIVKHIDIKLTKLGEKIITVDYDFGNTVDTLTSSMLKDGSWKNKKFREYDISSPVPKIQRGRRHPVK